MSVPDRALDPIARRQHGAFNIAQARHVGFTKSMIERRVRDRAWIRKARGVYALASAPGTWEQRLMVSTLSKAEAAVFGLAAAALHDLEGFPRCRAEIVVPRWVNHRSQLARVHRRDEIDRTHVKRIPVVTALQTLFDVSGQVPTRMLLRATEAALLNGLVRRDQLADRFVQLAPTLFPGIGDMRTAIETFCDIGFAPLPTVLEVLLIELLDELGLEYRREVALPWRAPVPMIVDALIPALGLIVEADGRAWHGRLEAFESDRLRDNAAVGHGFATMRFTFTMLTTGRPAARASLRAVIDRCASLDAPPVHPIPILRAG